MVDTKQGSTSSQTKGPIKGKQSYAEALLGLPLSKARAAFGAFASLSSVVSDAVHAAWDRSPVIPSSRFVPSAPPAARREDEALDVWGFRDTRFQVQADRSVVLSGARYELAGKPLPNLIPWVKEVMELDVDPTDVHTPHEVVIPRPKTNTAFLDALKDGFTKHQYSDNGRQRVRHGHGHTQAEMYAIKYGKLDRVPDLIVYPETDEHVALLVQLAAKHGVCLIPFGGGTNVTEALRCRPVEQRMIVSVDMGRMNRILWVDPVNRMACIQAGAMGRHLMDQLAENGFTLGHEPDSMEFSTLGGWIATNASGMKKNRYGNIEDIVLDVEAVSTAGVLRRSSVAPRESVGIDQRRVLFGSEGKLGIITSAVVKIVPLPEVQRYGSILFASFEEGCAFMYEMTQADAQPASVRLVDNLQFQFGMALKPSSQGWRVAKSKIEKLFVTKLKGFEPQKMVAVTLVFEGSKAEVEAQEEAVYRIAAKNGGMKAGGENGRRGYQLTYGIAYIRDFIMSHWVLAESFETSVPWSQVTSLCENVKKRLYAECAARGLPGKPFVTCRVTQVYRTGAAVYFYFAFAHKGVENPSQVYAEIEHIARAEILRQGGSLSHHHGIGKLRQDFLPEIMSPAALAWRNQVKVALDPHNVFGSSNQEPGESHAASPTRGASAAHGEVV